MITRPVPQRGKPRISRETELAILEWYSGQAAGSRGEAMARLADVYMPLLRAIVRRRLLSNPHVVPWLEPEADLVHDLIIELDMALAQHPSSKTLQSLTSWIAVFAQRKLSDRIDRAMVRRRNTAVPARDEQEPCTPSRKGDHGMSGDEPDPYHHLERQQRIQHLTGCLEVLTSRARELLRLSCLDYKLEEIAAITGYSAAASVCRARNDAFEAVRECMKEQGWEVGNDRPTFKWRMS